MTDPSSTFNPASLADFSGQIGRRSRPRLFIRLVFVVFALVFVIGTGFILWQRGRTATEPRAAALAEVNGLVELRKLVLTAQLIVKRSQRRHERRGLHFSRDYPDTLPRALETVLHPRQP